MLPPCALHPLTVCSKPRSLSSCFSSGTVSLANGLVGKLGGAMPARCCCVLVALITQLWGAPEPLLQARGAPSYPCRGL